MKLRYPCCSSEVAPLQTNDVFNFDMGQETPPEGSRDHLPPPEPALSRKVPPFEAQGTDQEDTTGEPVLEIRVERSEGTRSLSRTANADLEHDYVNVTSTSHKVIPSSLQLLILSWIQPMENKANTKLFGSAKAVKNEQTRHKEAGWIIHPCSAFRLYWNLLMMVLLIMNMYALPVVITFFHDDLPLSWVIFNILSDIFFLTDLVLNFRTGYMVNHTSYRFVLEPKKIAKNYLRGWFFVDLISSLPLDYIITAISNEQSELAGASRALRVLRLAKLLSLLRLLRVTRLVRYVSQYEVIFNWTKSFMRFVNLIAVMTLVTHWNACLQYLVPSLTDFPSSSWVSIHRLDDTGWSTKYIWSAFKALSHMLCIGYGRFPPQNIQEVIVTCFSMVSGATCYGIFIAYCIAAIQQTDSSRRHYRERVQQIAEYMSNRKLPTVTREKVLKYFEHRYKGKFFDERAILGEISSPLRNEIISHNCRDLVNAVPFFNEADPVFVSAIITKLSFEVFLSDDVIIQEGTMGTEMYFLREGSVEIRVKNELQNVLYDGSYFGGEIFSPQEICLLTNARRVASVVATSTCDTFVLSTTDFHEVLEDFPEMRAKMEKVAEQRLSYLRRRQANRMNTGNVSSVDYVEPAVQQYPEV